MDYLEVLHFIGQCLSLAKYPERKEQVKAQINSGIIEWEKVVMISSRQYVLPALFIRLQKADLLNELPPDLVEYLDKLTDLNRERNLGLIEQAEEINQLLTEQGIEPVFLKGTAFLLCGLYDDPAERMIGDIDLLVQGDEMEKAANILILNGYKPLANFNINIHGKLKHYPRLTIDDKPAAVEVHQQVLRPPHYNKFSVKDILNDRQKLESRNGMFVPSYCHMLIHNALNVQVNDNAYIYYTVHLRHMYDLLLLSMKEDTAKSFEQFRHLKNHIEAWLLISTEILGTSCLFQKSISAKNKLHLKKLRFFLAHPNVHKMHNTLVYFKGRLWGYFITFSNAIRYKEDRLGLYARLSNPKWYGQHIMSYIKQL